MICVHLQRHQQPAEVPVDAKVSARKAASLAEQRSRFRRALGEDEEPTTEVCGPAILNVGSPEHGAGPSHMHFLAYNFI